MPIDRSNVRPGGLITAGFIEQVLDKLDELEGRVAALEDTSEPSDGQVNIDNVIPSGTLTVGQEVVVLGENFEFSVGGHRVTVAGQPINAFRSGTGDGQLIFEIPGIPDLTEESSVTLRVENRSSFDTYPITVQPVQSALVGSVDVVFEGATPETIETGAAATFSYTLHSRLNRRATVTLVPRATLQTSTPEDWSDLVSIRTSDGDPIVNSRVDIGGGETREVQLHIESIPQGGDGETFTIRLDARAGGSAVGTSGSETITVGEAIVPPDDTITLGSLSLSDQMGSVDLAGTSLEMGSEASALLRLAATFSQEGTYDLSTELAEDATRWSATIFEQQANPVVISSADLGAGPVERNLQFIVESSGTELVSSSLTFRVQRRGADRSRTFSIDLVPAS